MDEVRVVVVSRHWHESQSELSFLARAVAGAASRWAEVTVLAPGDVGSVTADGAFDVRGIGSAETFTWPLDCDPRHPVVVDELTPGVQGMLRAGGASDVWFLASTGPEPEPGWRLLRLVANADGAPFVNLHVPLNPLARAHRHNGFGFTDYQLVLAGIPANGDPPPAAAWLTAAAPLAWVVVVEAGVASAWRGRALRGRVAIETRMDLWRLMAHANSCIDLGPGHQFGRECLEALRLGTPIMVPEGCGAAEVHAVRSGGTVFGDPGELVAAADRLRNTSFHAECSRSGRAYADGQYGNPVAVVTSLRSLLTGVC